jgi:hypothetical protein
MSDEAARKRRLALEAAGLSHRGLGTSAASSAAAATVAWNPSINGGAKSEDTALVTNAGAEVITGTPELGELETAGSPRPAITAL